MEDCEKMKRERSILRNKTFKNVLRNDYKKALEYQKKSMDLKWRILEECQEGDPYE